MPFLRGIEEVRSQEYTKEYLWDVAFPDMPGRPSANMPGGANGWWPAVDVEEGIANITSHEQPFYASTYKVPMSSTSREIQVTFAEFADYRISKWLEQWMNSAQVVSGSNRYVELLSNMVRQVVIEKLFAWSNEEPGTPGRTRAVAKRTIYYVYPEGELRWHGSSESSAVLFTATFVIAGYMK